MDNNPYGSSIMDNDSLIMDKRNCMFVFALCRMVGNVSTPTTRQIRFNLDHVVANGTYTLRIALAAAQMSRLTVHMHVTYIQQILIL